LVLPALAAWLLIPKLASAQQPASLYVRFDFGTSNLHTFFDAGRQSAEASLSQKLLEICDRDLSIWNFALDADKYPRLLARLGQTNADLQLHIYLELASLQPIEVQNRLILTFGPDELSEDLLAKKIVETFRQELRTQDNWSHFLGRIKSAPLGHLRNMPLVALEENGRVGGVLPLDYQRFRRFAASQFRIDCEDDQGESQKILCFGKGRARAASVGLSSWIMRIFYLKLGSQDIDPTSLPVLRTLKGKSVYLEEYQPNLLEDDDIGGGLEIAGLATDTGGNHP
jgi:hypothetical protein